jgi:NAD(P)-dependent dehydrogenase (short-subunit alcohol dehydrogenase family)
MYQAAKFGLGGFSEALAKEVAPLGIRVTCIEPGGFRTDWAGASMSYAPEIEGYEESVGKRSEYFRSGGYIPVGDPVKAAKVMVKLAEEAQPPVHLVLGSEAIAILEKANAVRDAELREWRSVSTSTDADDADTSKFFSTGFGKSYK